MPNQSKNSPSNVYEIHKSDILWKFYCKELNQQGKEIEHPKNFCNYFWIAKDGFIFWTTQEINLWRLWAITIATLLVSELIELSFGLQDDSLILYCIVFIVGGILSIALFLSILRLFSILDELGAALWKKVPKRTRDSISAIVFAVIFLSIALIMIAFFSSHPKLLNEFLSELKNIAIIAFLSSFALLIVVMIVMRVLIKFDFFRKSLVVNKWIRFFGQIIEFFRSLKNRFCPLVKLPKNSTKN